MDYTQNLNLPQWEKTDRLMMDDFNDAMAKIDTAVTAAPKITTGTYEGTGQYGAAHPNTLTLDFPPKLLLVGHAGENSSWFLWIEGCAQSKWGGDPFVEAVTADGNSISWYVCAGNSNYRNASYQCNSNGETYRYLAIG